ncbi:hypothetical protein IWW37_005244 [Coemansia sp. RSA 2050]|nr:hypothetical protein IWW37_005244 [Coemansia sp. RSA 2050]KAJ2730483.1 hypothetical protein IW152_005207 [Coemansia sp. BCRC 34962]
MADAAPKRNSGGCGDDSRSTLAVASDKAVVPKDDNSPSDNTPSTPSSAQQSELLTFSSFPPISLSNRRRSSAKTPSRITPIDTKAGGHRKADSAIEDAALMLARAKVANDLLFKDPKRVVIEDGFLQADKDTLRSLIDVSSPAPMPDAGDRVLEVEVDMNSYAVYPEGDERALPGFILSCMTVEDLDQVTGAWERALETLSDRDFWRAVISDLDGLSRRAPLHLSAKIRAGIPALIRGVVWQALTQAQSTYLQTVYTQLVKEYSPHERVIRRDLTRTFPKIPVFKSEGGCGQQRLFRILKAYSLYDAEVGYCQGLGFIIGPLLMSMGECEAFCVLVRLMETYDLRGMFTEDMAGLHLRLYQFQELATEIAGDVVAHLDHHGVVPAMYVPSWFLSLFAYTMPLSFVLRAMDVIVAEGAPESIMRIGIALLQRNAEHILRQDDFESAMAAVNSGLYDDANNARDRPGYVLQEAAKLSAVVTRQRLDELEAQYCREQGVVLKGRQSTSTQATQVATPTAQQAITKFLGWPWGKDHGLTPQPTSASRARPRASEAGRISPRVLELTEAQQLQSRKLREQVLLELQSQPSAPATVLGGEIKTRESAESTKTAVADSASDAEEPPRSAAVQGHRDGTWRDEVLEPLNRQLHDARATCASHRDALVALQADHELLRAELAAAKADRVELASDNEQLRMLLRRAESATAAADERAEYSGERSKRAEDMLIAARVELAEADEERALLVKQLGNLRKFIAESGHEEPMDRARLLSVDGGSRPTPAPTRFSISSIGSAIRGAITSPRQQQDPPPLMSPPPMALSPPPLATRQHSSIPLASLHRSKTTPPGTVIATSPLPSSRNTINSSIIN